MNNQNPIKIYQAQDGTTQVEVRFENDTVWLSLQQMADLFGRDKSVISRHLRNIYTNGELNREATVAKNAYPREYACVGQGVLDGGIVC